MTAVSDSAVPEPSGEEVAQSKPLNSGDGEEVEKQDKFAEKAVNVSEKSEFEPQAKQTKITDHFKLKQTPKEPNSY